MIAASNEPKILSQPLTFSFFKAEHTVMFALLCVEHSENDDGGKEVHDGVGDHHVFTA